jgi:hypothetical protein
MATSPKAEQRNPTKAGWKFLPRCALKCSVVWFLQILPELLSGFVVHLIPVLA